MNRKQLAAMQIKTAIDQLQLAKANLRHERNKQHIHLATQIAMLEDIYDALTYQPEEMSDDE